MELISSDASEIQPEYFDLIDNRKVMNQ